MNLSLGLIMTMSVLAGTQQDLLTNTAQGVLRGITRDGYVSYIGVPYASLNGSKTRFKRAEIAPVWKGVREIRGKKLSCYSEPSGTEDCLQLDIHVPFRSTPEPWPVLVWVPGGPGQYHPMGLVNKGLILITVNYRMGPLGFLCYKESIPGNAGVKDIVLALRWVRDNIVAFRGNPSRVVVAGHSLGAALVEAMVLSPMSRNLFHGAVMQSGSALCPWAYNYDARRRARALAKLYTDSSDEEYISNALLEAKSQDLSVKSKKLNLPYFPFAMCAEKPHKKEEILLTEAPIDALKAKSFANVPIMIGFNSDEAYILISHLKRLKRFGRRTDDYTFLLPDELAFLDDIEVKRVAKQIKDTYFPHNITLEMLLVYYRDAYFVNHIDRSARLHADAGDTPVFYYQFSQSGKLGVETEHDVNKKGAAHSDELAYLFAEGGKTLDGDSGIVQDQLLTLWSNFVKHINPTPPSSNLARWEAYSANEPRILNIGVRVEMIDYPYSTTTQLWDDIYHKYYYRRQNNDFE